jgi:hypothetical protein
MSTNQQPPLPDVGEVDEDPPAPTDYQGPLPQQGGPA